LSESYIRELFEQNHVRDARLLQQVARRQIFADAISANILARIGMVCTENE
jgi:hypothetical protein